MKKFIASLLTGVMALSALAGCASAPASSSASETSSTVASSEVKKEFSVDKIAVTYVKAPLNVPSIVEKEKGIFAKTFSEYNLPVEYSNLTTGPEQTQALASGDIQFLNAVGATSVILAAANDSDIKIVSMYGRAPQAYRLFAKGDAIKSAADLKGKKIAGPKGTILHEMLVAYLATANLTEKDINFVSMAIPDAQAALAAGQVDGALLAGPVAYNMGKEGYTVVTTGEGLVDGTIVTATSNAFYEKNPELVKAFLKAQKETLDYIQKNEEEVMGITAKETELSADAVKEMYPMYNFDAAISASDIEAMKKTEKFMKDNAMIEKDVDIDSLILNVK